MPLTELAEEIFRSLAIPPMWVIVGKIFDDVLEKEIGPRKTGKFADIPADVLMSVDESEERIGARIGLHGERRTIAAYGICFCDNE